MVDMDKAELIRRQTAERQRRFRKKIASEKSKARYLPEQFIAKAVCRLRADGVITDRLLQAIQSEAYRCIRETFEGELLIASCYAEKLVLEYFEEADANHEIRAIEAK